MKRKFRKLEPAEIFYAKKGPLTLFAWLCDMEIGRLNKLRDSMLYAGVKFSGIQIIDRQTEMLKEKKGEILNWMEEAIQKTTYINYCMTGNKNEGEVK